jgi:hypothetical protein
MEWQKKDMCFLIPSESIVVKQAPQIGRRCIAAMNKIEKFEKFAPNNPGFIIETEPGKLIYSGLFRGDRYSIPARFEITNSGDNYLLFLLSQQKIGLETETHILLLLNSVNLNSMGYKCFLGPTTRLLNGIVCYVSGEHTYQPEWFFDTGRSLAFSCLDTLINLQSGNDESVFYRIVNGGPSKVKMLEEYAAKNRDQWVFNGQWRKTPTEDFGMQLSVTGRIAEVHTTMGEFHFTYALFVDDSVFSRLVCSFFRLPDEVNLSKVMSHLNELNSKYRNQKFFIFKSVVYMHITYMSLSEYFDPKILHDAFKGLLSQDFFEITEGILASITTVPSIGITHGITRLKSNEGDLLYTVMKNVI